MLDGIKTIEIIADASSSFCILLEKQIDAGVIPILFLSSLPFLW